MSRSPRRLRSFILLLAVLCVSFPARANEYLYDQVTSKVFFTLKHMGIVTLKGDFQDFSGWFHFDPAQVENSKVQIVIDTTSVHSGIPSIDDRLRSRHFFWSDKYPQITFTSKQFKEVQPNQFNIDGDLTIRGITKPVTFETELRGESLDPAGKKRLVFNSFTKIKRKDFELGSGGFTGALDKVGHEELKINLEVQGVPKKE